MLVVAGFFILTVVGGVLSGLPPPPPPPTCEPEVIGCNGDPNAVYSNCSSACQPSCDDPKTNKACILVCREGCVCKPNYILIKADGKCINPKDCPPGCNGDPNAKYTDCTPSCPPVCNSDPHQVCTLECRPPSCICLPGFVLDKISGKCIDPKCCPEKCPIPEECKRTCKRPNPPNCDYREPPKTNIDGCECKQGYILSKTGVCIKIEDCPNELGCNGDPHAKTKLCPTPCPSTCQAPNAVPCKKQCLPIGCECEDGYLLSNSTGICILPDQCPGGNPCGKGGIFVPCRVPCPRDYCPVDDRRDIIICDPPTPCLSGCICDLNHKKKSIKDPRCIVASDCPPVCCTRPNEIWDSCPSACLAEDCKDIKHQPTSCNPIVLNCDPRCICKKGYFRNSKGICIPACDCPC